MQRKRESEEHSTVWPNMYDDTSVQPNICENIGPIFMTEGGTVSSFILEVMPNICENLQHKYLADYTLIMFDRRITK
jgi:hypothetical protein